MNLLANGDRPAVFVDIKGVLARDEAQQRLVVLEPVVIAMPNNVPKNSVSGSLNQLSEAHGLNGLNGLNDLNFSRPINVLMITGIFPPDIGGPATYVPEMGRELVKRGHKITVLTLSDTLDHDDRSYSFPVHRIRRSLFKPAAVSAHCHAHFHEKDDTAQVLYVNGLYLEAVVANFFLRKPLVQKIVGDWAWERATNKGWVEDSFEEFQERKYRLKVEFLKTLRSVCARRADTVIVPSRFLARAVANWGVPEKKIAVIYNSVDPISPSPYEGEGRGEGASSFAGLRPVSIPVSTPYQSRDRRAAGPMETDRPSDRGSYRV